ncbi:DUF2568 domain-containing protein [Paenibacillus sp. HJL G12]|uniref:DUF2568 domain-containing protein n=2 Tax=Paenibacillus dendrobii TaxID=2691084 RepID=A0A7X3IG50_9BACL|nr:YrdB family protein [Paenibacillus dendrobii]MWV43314.1 DUF2568 domain-containing protein [Paenibacillus dendrobii]
MLNLLLRFVLELVLLFSLGYWGFHVQTGIYLQWVAGLGVPVLAAFVWGLFVSPKASVNVPLFAVLVIEAALFAAAFMCNMASGWIIFAFVFAGLAVLNRFIILICKQQEISP